MTRDRVLLGVGILVVVVMTFLCSAAMQPDFGGGLGVFDLGEGRSVRVWSQPQFGDPSTIWFDVWQEGQVISSKRCLGLRKTGDYSVQTCLTADGKVSATWSAEFTIYVDWSDRRVWPGGTDKELPDWKKRYLRLRADNPQLPTDKLFE